MLNFQRVSNQNKGHPNWGVSPPSRNGGLLCCLISLQLELQKSSRGMLHVLQSGKWKQHDPAERKKHMVVEFRRKETNQQIPKGI